MRLGRVGACLLVGLLLMFLPPLPTRDHAHGPDAPPAEKRRPPVSDAERQLRKDVADRNSEAILAFFRDRTPADPDRLRLLVRQLGAASSDQRDRAAADLLAVGRPVLGLLRPHRYDADPEIASRARRLVETLEDEELFDLIATAARRLDSRETLLAYAPFAEDERVEAAVHDALAAAGPHQLLNRSLNDPEPLRRAAAAVTLIRLADDAGRRLLLDPEPEVRYRVALALLRRRDRGSIPILIDLLGTLADERRDRVEEMLGRASGEHVPAVPRGTDADSRRQGRDAWAGWWRDHADSVDLTRLEVAVAEPGPVVLLDMNLDRFYGQAVEVSVAGRSRALIRGLDYPIGLQTLADDRLLVAEYRSGRVTERDRNGDVVWTFKSASPVVSAQRLASGNTLVALRNRVLEVNRDGKELLSLPRSVKDIAAARAFPFGPVCVVTLNGACQHFDRQGKELCRFPVGQTALGAGIDTLPVRRVLIPEYLADRVAEYDPDGRLSWQTSIEKPTAAVRLSNGHTLIGSTTTRLIVEVDRDGRVVWKHEADAAVMAVGRR